MLGVDSAGFVYRNPFLEVPAPAGLLVSRAGATHVLANPAIDPNEETFVGVIEGQSLAAAHVQGTYVPTTKVDMVDLLGGKQLYRFKEPMIGTSYYSAGHNNWPTDYETVWGKLADLINGTLVKNGRVVRRVIWCNASYGGVSAADLAPGGILGNRIPLAFRALRLMGIAPSRVDAVFTMHGEGDGALGTPKATYKSLRFSTIQSARDIGFTGPWFVPKETYALDIVSSTIRDAQAEMAGTNGVVAGPDFDDLGQAYRYHNDQNQYTHLNAAGRDAVAARWLSVLQAHYN